MLHLLGFKDRLTAIDEPITANMVDGLEKGDIFVDVGANICLYALLATK